MLVLVKNTLLKLNPHFLGYQIRRALTPWATATGLLHISLSRCSCRCRRKPPACSYFLPHSVLESPTFPLLCGSGDVRTADEFHWPTSDVAGPGEDPRQCAPGVGAVSEFACKQTFWGTKSNRMASSRGVSFGAP